MRIVSQGEDLLASPASILIEVDGGGPVSWGPAELVEEQPVVVRLRSRLKGPVQGHGLTTIEYDGMIRVDLVLDAGVRLRAVRYEFELARGVGKWFNRHVPYSYESLNVDKELLLSSAGVLPEGRLGFEFTPTLFVGNRQVGIEWWGETNAHWVYPMGGEPIEIERSGDDARIRVAPVAQRVRPGPEGWSDRFALFPAPMRPARDDWRSTRFVVWRVAKRFKAPWARYFWISFPGHFRPSWHGLPSSDGSREQQEIRSNVRRAGVGYIPYGKLTAGPSYHPRTLEMRDEWSANRQMFTFPPSAERKVLERNTKWKPKTPYSYAVCMRHTDYLNWILDENLTALRDEALDGLYFDFGSISRMCQRDPRVRKRGRDEAWNYFTLRLFYKSLYEQMQLVNPDAILTAHTHGQPRALSAYLDYNFVGEALNTIFRGGKSWGAIEGKPHAYDPDYYALPEGFLDALLLPRVGGVTSLLPELKQAADPKNPSRLRRYQRELLSLVLVNDIHMWFANSDFNELVRVYRAIDSFGPLHDATLHPWWDADAPVRADSLLATAYTRNGKALLVVANHSDSARTASLELDADALGIPQTKELRDLESGDRIPVAAQDAFEIKVPRRNFRLLVTF